MTLDQLNAALSLPSTTQLLEELYGAGNAAFHADRYLTIARGFCESFGHDTFELFSSPGRTEIGGNHTDHNHGKIVAGSVHLDCIAAAAANGTDHVRIISAVYHQDITIDLKDLEPQKPYSGTRALIKGVLQGMKDRGYHVSGFDVYTTSNVPGGAGVSSSASFEMLLCTIVDYLFNSYSQDFIAYAKAGQFAENVYWNKGSGLLDQLSCAVGGIITIDFANIAEPKLKKLNCHFSDLGLDLVLVNTGGSHADLSEEYSSIPNEMKQIAAHFGKQVLSEINEQTVLENVMDLRKAYGDRSVLRALHFFSENHRVDSEVAALEANDTKTFLENVAASGNSSWKWLQNCYVNATPHQQSLTCALALAETYLSAIPQSACRVHGGGFAGVLAAFLPKEETTGFCNFMDRSLGTSSSTIIHIRPYGAIHLAL